MKRMHFQDRGFRTGVKTVLLVSFAVSFALVAVTAAAGTPALSADGDSATGLQDDEFEPNDEFETAAAITAPFESDSLETGPEDADFFAVDLARGDGIDVSVAFEHDDGDVDLVLYDPRRNVVASSLSITNDESASVRANENGTFYALVLSPTNDTVPYSISVEREAGDVARDDQFEPNDGFDSATNVSTSFARDGLRIVTYDRDLFAVELASGSELAVSARFDHNETDVDLRLYDRNRTLVAGSATVTNEESMSTRIEEAGVYYVEVDSANDSSGAYSLSIQGSEATPTEAGTTASRPGTATTAKSRTGSERAAGTRTEPATSGVVGTGTGRQRATSMATGQTARTPATTAAEGPGFTAFLALLALGVCVASRLQRRAPPGRHRE